MSPMILIPASTPCGQTAPIEPRERPTSVYVHKRKLTLDDMAFAQAQAHVCDLEPALDHMAPVPNQCDLPHDGVPYHVLDQALAQEHEHVPAEAQEQAHEHEHDLPPTPDTCLLYTSPSPRD